MNRRKLLKLALALPVTSLAGCGSGWNLGFGPIRGGGSSGDGILTGTRSVSGTLTLPAGFALTSSALMVKTGAGSQKVSSSGAFSAQVSTEPTGPTLAWCAASDKPILMGFLADTGAVLSARSTAVALLYFALGGHMVAATNKTFLLAQLDAHPAVGELETVITARLAANPSAIVEEDPAIGAALKTAVEAILTQRTTPSRAALPPKTRVTRAEGNALLLTTPNTLQSNVELLQGTAPHTIVLSNHARRYCQIYLYEVGKVDKNGLATNYTKAKVVSTTRLGSTRALGIMSTIFGFYSGQTAFVPVSTQPLPLTMATDAKKTLFEVVVLGSSSLTGDPAIYSDPRYIDAVSGWRESRLVLNFISWFADVLLGLLLEIWGLRDIATNEAAIEAAVTSLRALQIQSWFEVAAAVETGDFSRATQLFLKLCVSDTSFFLSIAAILSRLSPALQAILSKEALAASGQLALKLLLAPLNVVGVLVGGGDLGAVLWDLAHSEQADQWQATLFTSDVSLSPAAETIEPGDSLVLTANVPTVPGAANIRYKWTLSGSSLANLSDAKEGKVGSSFETTGSVVTLATTPSTQGTLTVTVEANETAKDGSQVSHGQAQSQIKVNDDVPFGMVKVKFDGKTRLLPKYSTQRLGGTTGLALGALYQQVSTAYGGKVALKLILQFSTKTLSVGSTASVVSDYDLTYELPEGNDSLYFAPSAPGALTVTEVGEGYFGYTLSVNLKGLRGVPITGPATALTSRRAFDRLFCNRVQ